MTTLCQKKDNDNGDNDHHHDDHQTLATFQMMFFREIFDNEKCVLMCLTCCCSYQSIIVSTYTFLKQLDFGIKSISRRNIHESFFFFFFFLHSHRHIFNVRFSHFQYMQKKTKIQVESSFLITFVDVYIDKFTGLTLRFLF